MGEAFQISAPYAAYPWVAGYQTAFTLRGNFTVDADFALNNWPDGNHVRIGINFLIPSQGAVERTSMGWEFDEVYIFDGVGHGHVPTSDTEGTLRLVRSGTTLTGYYLNGTEWAFVGSGTVTTADAVIALIAWPDYTGGGGVGLTFENPAISGIAGGAAAIFQPISLPTPGVPETSCFLINAVLVPLAFQRIRRLNRPNR